MNTPRPLDSTDVTLLRILRRQPKIPVAALARAANVARGTAQARLDRLERDGIIVGYGPDLDRRPIGYDVLAFAMLEIEQGHDDAIAAHLEAIAEVLEVHAITGTGDLMCKVVARTNEHLHEVLQSMLAASGIRRTETHLVLRTRIERREIDLITDNPPPGK